MAQHNFNDYKLLIGQQAMKGYKRLMGNGVSVDYDDVFQQMSLTFCVASEKFDPSKGFAFTTYLVRAIWHQFNKWAETQIAYRQHTYSVDELLVNDEGQDRDNGIYDLVASDASTPEQIVLRRQDNERALKRISKEARDVVEVLANPSARTNEEWDALKAHHAHGRAMGVSSRRLPEDMNFTFAFDQLGLSQRRRNQVKRELGDAFGVKLL